MGRYMRDMRPVTIADLERAARAFSEKGYGAVSAAMEAVDYAFSFDLVELVDELEWDDSGTTKHATPGAFDSYEGYRKAWSLHGGPDVCEVGWSILRNHFREQQAAAIKLTIDAMSHMENSDLDARRVESLARERAENSFCAECGAYTYLTAIPFDTVCSSECREKWLTDRELADEHAHVSNVCPLKSSYTGYGQVRGWR